MPEEKIIKSEGALRKVRSLDEVHNELNLKPHGESTQQSARESLSDYLRSNYGKLDLMGIKLPPVETVSVRLDSISGADGNISYGEIKEYLEKLKRQSGN